MRYESEEKKNLIYDLMNGSLVLDEVKDLWKDQVVDEFAKGSYCSELYEEVYQAKVSLCNRLGVQEDSDIETVISNLLLIGKHLSMKMFVTEWKKNANKRKNTFDEISSCKSGDFL